VIEARHRKSLTAIGAKSTMQYDEKTVDGAAKMLSHWVIKDWGAIVDKVQSLEQIFFMEHF